MNQMLADMFLALPRALTEPRVFGSVCLALCWLGHVFFVRATVTRAVRERCGEKIFKTKLSHFRSRLFYGAVRREAHLDENGLYAFHLGSLLVLVMSTVIHVLLFWLDMEGCGVASVADRVLLTVVVSGEGMLCFRIQPAVTVERRLRWGFDKKNAVIHAVLWEIPIAATLLLWLYDAWFLPALIL